MKVKIDDFFDRLKNYKKNRIKKLQNLFYTLMGIWAVLTYIYLWILVRLNAANDLLIIMLIVAIFIFLALFILYTFFSLKLNTLDFYNGKFDAALRNYAISAVVVYALIIIMIIMSPNDKTKNIFLNLISPITTIFAAILAAIGVHFSIIKKDLDKAFANNLVFTLVNICDETIEIKDAEGNTTKNLNLKNCSNNTGYLIGIYALNDDYLWEIGKSINYQPILPNTSYVIKNIKYFEKDKYLILIYTDISKNYYYISFEINNGEGIKILSVDKCDFDFVKTEIEKSNNYNNEIAIRNIDYEDSVIQRKKATKPINTINQNGYELILDGEGNIKTDLVLLNELKKIRLRISRRENVRAYMIFNNQQLVMLATYKPKNKDEFISLYGLGEGRYNSYGKEIIDLIISYEFEK